jgi:hypothetical protein
MAATSSGIPFSIGPYSLAAATPTRRIIAALEEL